MKIIDRIKKGQEEGRPLFSFEYFSPKTAQVLHKQAALFLLS
jgi:methylenetetrahydrofolate reductase (NADPH)